MTEYEWQWLFIENPKAAVLDEEWVTFGDAHDTYEVLRKDGQPNGIRLRDASNGLRPDPLGAWNGGIHAPGYLHSAGADGVVWIGSTDEDGGHIHDEDCAHN